MGFRSSWEANFARVLRYYNINFEYENKDKSYKLKNKEDNDKYKYASNIYLPDFIIDNKIIEIKGEMDYRSLGNIKLFRELYPDDYKNLIIIDSDIYYMLSKKYRNIIDNWEDDQAKVFTNKISVVGINYYNRRKFINNLSIGDELYYKRNYNNKYDYNCIEIYDKDNNMIGYISSDFANYYAPKMDFGIKYKIILKSIKDSKLDIDIKAINLDDLDIQKYLIFLNKNTN